MLEIIAIIYLAAQIGKLARSKGLRPGKWQFFSVLFWIIGELIGVAIGISIDGMPEGSFGIFSLYPFAFGGAIIAHFLFYNYLKRQPDNIDDDEIEGIGVDDLYPKRETKID